MEPAKLLEILSVCEKLKCNTRHCYTSSGRQESVAEHCWRMAVMAMLVEDEYPGIDICKVMKMCLIHDLGEAFTGDIPVFLKVASDEDTEAKVIDEWIDSFPSSQREEWTALFDEMNLLESTEAKLFKALDKMEAVIQHNESDLSTWIPLEYDLQLTHGSEQVKFSDFTMRLKAEVDKVTRAKIERG